MSDLSASERARLARLHERTASRSPLAVVAGARLADRLRRRIPDVDDVTIGRIALELSGYLAEAIGPLAVLAVTPEKALNVVHAQLICAGLDLTELEWREPPCSP